MCDVCATPGIGSDLRATLRAIMHPGGDVSRVRGATFDRVSIDDAWAGDVRAEDRAGDTTRRQGDAGRNPPTSGRPARSSTRSSAGAGDPRGATHDTTRKDRAGDTTRTRRDAGRTTQGPRDPARSSTRTRSFDPTPEECVAIARDAWAGNTSALTVIATHRELETRPTYRSRVRFAGAIVHWRAERGRS